MSIALLTDTENFCYPVFDGNDVLKNINPLLAQLNYREHAIKIT